MYAVILRSLLLVATTSACDVSYDFGSSADAVTTSLSVTLTWWQVLPQPSKPNVYMSTATGTACNSGYFGAQFHGDGSTTLLFSMWDAPSFQNNSQFVFQSLPGSPNCRRNALDASGKSTGVQCAPGIANETVKLELGVPYVFNMSIIYQNVSGALWEVSMRDSFTGKVTSIGKIFFVDVPMGLPSTCRTLGRSQNPPASGLSSYTFQEYFEQPRNFLTSATWSDMVAVHHLGGGDGKEHRPVGIISECCDHGDWKHGDTVNGSSASCLPRRCASPAIHFSMGPKLLLDDAIVRDHPTCLGPPPPPPPCPADQFCPLLADPNAQGGCATEAESYPPDLPGGHMDSVADAAACEAACVAVPGAACAAYSFCTGSNCQGSCNLLPTAKYTRQNGYPSVVCRKRGPFDYPPSKAVEVAPYRSLARTRPVF